MLIHRHTTIESSLPTAPKGKRTNVTRACDHCRHRKTVCDAQKPTCFRCRRANIKCTYLVPSQKRGPKATINPTDSISSLWTTFHDPATTTTHSSEERSRGTVYMMPASTDPFSKEVTDHLLQIFFEHCFQDFNCFSPVAFLRLYLQGTINPDLLYAVCAVAARFSNHPAVVRTPPSSSGQVYVDRIKAGMIHLLAQVNLDAVHTLILLSHAEYCAGHHPQGYRLAGMAARMLPELGLHRLKGPDKSFDSDTDRIAFEVKIRTLSLVAINDTIASLLSDQPGALEHTDIMYPTPENKVDWWIERISSGQAMEPMDDYSISILHKILRSNRTGVGEYQAYTLQLLSIGTTIRKFNNRVASSSKKRSPQGTGKELQIPNPTVTTTTTPIPNTAAPSTTDGCQVQDVQGAYQVAETELKRWRANIPEHWEPTKSIFLASQTENDGLPTVALYNVLVILLNRPVLLKACMSTISRKESHGPFGVIHGDGAKVSEPCVGKDGYVSPDNTRERRGSESKEEEEADSQMLEAYLYKCVVAADEIATIVGRFTDDDVKYRGFNYSFAALMAGTVYIIQQLMNKDLTKVGIGEEGLMVCQHFLRTLGRYWGGAVDQDRLLDRRSLFDAAKVEDDSNTTTGDPLSDIVLTTSSSDADELNDFDLYNGGEDTQGQKMSLVFILPLEKDTQHTYSQDMSSTPTAEQHQAQARQQSVLDSVDLPLSSVPSSARSGRKATIGTSDVELEELVWMRPGKVGSLEEATLLSFEKLSMLEHRLPQPDQRKTK